jgi:hypothetical protein
MRRVKNIDVDRSGTFRKFLNNPACQGKIKDMKTPSIRIQQAFFAARQ